MVFDERFTLFIITRTNRKIRKHIYYCRNVRPDLNGILFVHNIIRGPEQTYTRAGWVEGRTANDKRNNRINSRFPELRLLLLLSPSARACVYQI